MKKTILILIFIPNLIFCQAITNHLGDVFDIREIESGSIVEYDFYQQGVFYGRTISVDGEKVFRFGKRKECKLYINGKKHNVPKKVGTILIKFFSQQGFTLYDKSGGQRIIPGGNSVYIRNESNQMWIKN